MKVAIALALALAAAQAQDNAQTQDAAAPAVASEAQAPTGAVLDEKVMNLEGQLKSLEENYLETKTTVDKLAKIKVSGYVQAQWQHTDTNGAASVAGGSFPANTDQRFQVRRGRLKTTYETATSRYVLQFDVIPAGLSIKDAYVTLMEPWLKTASFTMGVFDRPFGFEISYSSSSRESPERSRVYQTLFPGERDMGAKLELAPGSNLGMLQYLNLKGGVFTGMGPTANEIDSEQDMIGRVGFQAPFYNLNLAVDGGFSFYSGKIKAMNSGAFAMGDTSFLPTPAANDSLSLFDRKVMGADAQIYYDLPVIGGMSLRGEYLWGEIPGTQTASGPYGAATAAVYSRNVMGWYGIWVQNIGTKLQTVLKYDVFDPNTDIEASEMTGNNFRPADIKFSTLGLGLLYHWDENIRFTLYYDMVENETVRSILAGGPPATAALNLYRNDLSDNVLTFRMQAKF